MNPILWEPREPEGTQMAGFLRDFASHTKKTFSSYEEAHAFTAENPETFWRFFFDWAGFLASGTAEPAVDNLDAFPGAQWYPNIKMNFAENLLRFRDNRPALIQAGEDGVQAQLSYAELAEATSRFANALAKSDFQSGDVLAALMPNRIETTVALLGCTSLGGTWTSSSPDFGVQGILDRFLQVQPKVLLTVDGYTYKGKKIPLAEKLKTIVPQLEKTQEVIVLPVIGDDKVLSLSKTISYSAFLNRAESNPPLAFQRISLDHPLFIMYSSGTTGLPKCIVQGNGVLINHVKEHRLHTDIQRNDVFFYFTTCGWMMWNWLMSGLASGCTLFLYDGNPMYPETDRLWSLAEENGISVFGTSARYLTYLQQNGVRPKETYRLQKLRAVLSTGSVLPPEAFDYVYEQVKSDVQLSSVSGGTDLNGCFALGNPVLPVRRGELQCRGLGMAVQVYNEEGEPVVEEKGELVCEKPFPSMPLHFYNDPDGSRYKDAYFSRFEGVWCHGDFAMLTKEGGMILFGRSDATLNPGGVRIGTAEIYRVLESMPEIEDSVVVGQTYGPEKDERVVLFVKTAAGTRLDDALVQKIKNEIKSKVSPRHVPAIVLSAPDIPYTISMKKVEIAVRRILEGEEAKNRDALMNPESLDYFYEIREQLKN